MRISARLFGACVLAWPLIGCQPAAEAPAHRYALEWRDGRPLVFKEPRPGLVTVSGVSGSGTFALTARCLELELDGVRYTPILPPNFALEGGAVRAGGVTVPLNQVAGLDNILVDADPGEQIREQVTGHGCPRRFVAFTGIVTASGPRSAP